MATLAFREDCSPKLLTDGQLTASLDRLASSERHSTAELIAHLAEFDERGLHLGAGFSSLFAYCTQVLKLSEHASYHRIDAARASRRFPVILEKLREGSINLTTVRLLSAHLTLENHAALIDAASGRSKREVEELVAHRFPQPAVPSSMRKLPVVPAPTTARSTSRAPSPFDPPQDVALDCPTEPNATAAIATAPTAEAAPTPLAKAAIVPLAPDRYKITFTATAETREALQRARELLRHQIPDGDLAQIIGRALSAYVEQLEKKKGAFDTPPRRRASQTAPSGRPPTEHAGSRHIPADVRRAVWARDGGACAFRAPNGRRCGERGFVEFHHAKPYAAGGAASSTNIALRCRAHNGYEALLYYGPTRAGP